MNEFQKQRIKDLLAANIETQPAPDKGEESQQIISHSVIGHNITQTYTINGSAQYILLFTLFSLCLILLAIIFF